VFFVPIPSLRYLTADFPPFSFPVSVNAYFTPVFYEHSRFQFPLPQKHPRFLYFIPFPGTPDPPSPSSPSIPLYVSSPAFSPLTAPFRGFRYRNAPFLPVLLPEVFLLDPVILPPPFSWHAVASFLHRDAPSVFFAVSLAHREFPINQ